MLTCAMYSTLYNLMEDDTADYVVLVDENDRELGVMEKLQAHRAGALHRAFSVFVVNDRNEMLLQKRAAGKYHSAGLWSNACCSHPRPGEGVEEAAARRLSEELQLLCALKPAFALTYRHEFDNGLVEHEYDHILVGRTGMPPTPNGLEVEQCEYRSLSDIASHMEAHPAEYTVWFRLAFADVVNFIGQHFRDSK